MLCSSSWPGCQHPSAKESQGNSVCVVTPRWQSVKGFASFHPPSSSAVCTLCFISLVGETEANTSCLLVAWTNSKLHLLEPATQILVILHPQAFPTCGQVLLTQALAWDTFVGFLSSRGCRTLLAISTSWAAPPLVSWAVVIHFANVYHLGLGLGLG